MSDTTPRELYFDHAATTPLAPEVLEEMMPFLTGQFGNASTLYQLGVDARYAVEKARRRVARTIGARDDEILFTAGGTESDNLAIQGVLSAHGERGDHVISCGTEHSAVRNTLLHLEAAGRCRVTWLPVGESGRVDPVDVEKTIDDETVLITLMLANSETGVIHPIGEIGQIARERGVLFHCDAVQAIGKEAVDMSALGVDLLSLAAHKFHGPKGVGALWVREGVEIAPQIHGGSQERGLRAGTENVAGTVGMGKAIQMAEALRERERPRLRTLRDRLLDGLLAAVEDLHVNGDEEHRLAGMLNLSVAGVEGSRLVTLAAEEGIAIAAGSACTAVGTVRSHVLTAMGLPDERVEGAIRISLGRDNSEAAIDCAIERLPPLIHQLRRDSAA
jgi:cysteine desulfurase